MKRITMLFVSLLLCAVMGAVSAQDAKPYKDGAVVRVSFIKVKPGQELNYMKYLDGPYKASMEALKKAGLINGYAVYRSEARTPQDADLILTISYPNMAALDRTDEADAIFAKQMGSMESRQKATGERGAMREMLGSQLMREMILK